MSAKDGKGNDNETKCKNIKEKHEVKYAAIPQACLFQMVMVDLAQAHLLFHANSP